MTSKQLRLSIFSLVCIVFLSFYTTKFFKTTSLAKDILTEIDFNKVNLGFVVDVANETIRDLNEESLTTILSTLKTIDLERVQKRSELRAIDYIVSLSGSGGAFKLYLSNDGSLFIDGKLEETYQFVDNQVFNALLHVIMH